MNISIVLGTGREGRRSFNVAKYLEKKLRSMNAAEITFVDVRDHLSTFVTTRYGKEDMRPHAWKEIAGRTDGFVFVIPEYNHGYPGEWKLLMDSLYKSEYIGKVAGLVGVSDGVFGGARALELATLSLNTRGMYIMKDALYFPKVQFLFSEEGEMHDREQEIRAEKFLTLFLDTVQRYRHHV